MQVEEFFDLFGSYNEMYLIVIILTYVLAFVAMLMAFRKSDYSNRVISLTLTFLWLWIGIVFGFLVFGPVPAVMAGIEIPGAWYLFGGIFVIHGIILLYFGVIKDAVSFTWKPDTQHYIGLLLILYGLVLYPLVGILTGRVFPEYPVFGIAPCPVTLFTIGLLLWSDVKPSLAFFAIPIFWGFMGIAPVLFYEVFADIGTVLAAIIALYYYVKWPAD
ncbi:MAG: DUF6064 family protein [Candidatus Thorarchaeota archaeon]